MDDLLSLLPRIRRARGYRLYDVRGKRYLDLYQGGGAAILGHRAFRLSTAMKDTISRGLAFNLPSVYADRLAKLLSRLFPSYRSSRIASSLSRALVLVSLHLGMKVLETDILDPALQDFGDPKRYPVSLWRPFLADAVPEAEVLIPVLPFRVGEGPVAVCFKSELASDIAASDVVSPLLLAGACRATLDLQKLQQPEWQSRKLFENLRGWQRRGVYLKATFDPDYYPTVFRRFLEEDVLLSPSYPGPSILPAEVSPGELAKIADLFRKLPGV